MNLPSMHSGRNLIWVHRKDAPEISRDPHTSEPLEETGLQIPTTDPHEKKENPLDNPYNWIPGDDEPEPDKKKQPTLH